MYAFPSSQQLYTKFKCLLTAIQSTKVKRKTDYTWDETTGPSWAQSCLLERPEQESHSATICKQKIFWAKEVFLDLLTPQRVSFSWEDECLPLCGYREAIGNLRCCSPLWLQVFQLSSSLSVLISQVGSSGALLLHTRSGMKEGGPMFWASRAIESTSQGNALPRRWSHWEDCVFPPNTAGGRTRPTRQPERSSGNISLPPNALHQLGRRKPLHFGPHVLRYVPVLYETIKGYKKIQMQNKGPSPGYKVKGPKRFQTM